MTSTQSLLRSGGDGQSSVAPAFRRDWTNAELDRAGPRGAMDDDALPPFPIGVIMQGFLGMVLIAGGGIGATAGVLPDSLLNGTAFSWVRYGHGKQLSTAVLYLGLALLVWAWIKLGREARAGRVDRRGILCAIAAWTAPMLIAPPLFSHDVHTYLAQGDLALHGYNPYQYGVSVLNDKLSNSVDAMWQNTPTPYGPLFILIAKSVALIAGQSTIVGIVSMRLVLGVGLLLLCWALPRLADRLGGDPATALWFGAANPLVLTYLVGGAHNDLLMIGLLTAGTVLVLDGRHRYGILLVTLAFSVKATACVALPFLVWIWASRLPGSRGARLARAGGASLLVFLVGFLGCTVLAGVNLGWISALSDNDIIIDWLSVPTGMGQLTHTFAEHFGDFNPDPFLRFARDSGWLVMLALAGRQWWLAQDKEPAEIIRRASIALLVAVLFSPGTLPWYFTWPLVLAAGLSWSGPGLVLGCFASVWTMLSTYPTGTTSLYDWGVQAVALVVAAIAALSLVRPHALWPAGLRADPLRPNELLRPSELAVGTLR
ncbi:MAG TPA: polyprenol phosphomannose-dependent alpha 1,6 mannosyltransferase MptB [Pseudonocardiaceae bacterium]|jgi:alpha-1,6-mannosyltransferase|nr:polyprenol phosphomannose-dependent alpha 1,6 mannosyltransferase MptB [Pseudonocardiaceae bacterium]